MDPLLDTYDNFVDDLISSEINLLNGELDFLLFQHLFQSFDLEKINNSKFENNDEIAA